MSGIGWPSHDEDEKSRIARCYTEADQPTGCPLCILRAENERLGEALREILRHDSADEPPSHAEIPLDSCPSCIARAAIAAEEGK